MLAIISFSLWPTIAIILALVMTLLSTGGYKQLLYGSIFFLSGIFLCHFVQPPVFHFEGQTISSVISILFIFTYTIMISSLMLSFSNKYYKNRNSLGTANLEINKQNKQFKDDLALARKVQMSIIPKRLPQREGFEFAAIYNPMSAIGGDFYDFIGFKEQNLQGVFISDVSGHGIPAALITSMIKTLIDTAGINKMSPVDLLQYLNEKTLNITSDNFFTAFYAIIDTDNYTMTYARAGHCHPFLIRNNEVIKINSSGKFLGLLPSVSHECKTLKLEKGDTIFFYTDGLTEVINSKDEEFGDDILMKKLQQKNNQSINQFIRYIYDEAQDFNCQDEFNDDVCIIGMDVL